MRADIVFVDTTKASDSYSHHENIIVLIPESESERTLLKFLGESCQVNKEDKTIPSWLITVCALENFESVKDFITGVTYVYGPPDPPNKSTEVKE